MELSNRAEIVYKKLINFLEIIKKFLTFSVLKVDESNLKFPLDSTKEFLSSWSICIDAAIVVVGEVMRFEVVSVSKNSL